MLPFHPLLAVDWLEILIFLFIVTSSLVGQMFKVVQQRKKDAARKPKRPAAKLPPAGQPQARGEPVAGQPKTSLEKEIEAFLRKTLGGDEPAKPTPRQKPVPQRPGKPASAQQRTRPKAKPRPQPQQPPPRPPAFPEKESVGEHVQRHIRSRGIAERSAHLGEALEQADERMESHLHEVFDHRLGTLSGEGKRLDSSIHEGTDAEVWMERRPTSPLSAQLFQMLSTPQQVQAAVVLAEILRRPEERWSS